MKQLMLKIWIGLLILFLFHGLKAHEIDINLFNDYSVRTCVFSVYEGEFSLIANDKQLVTLSGDEIIYVSILANQVQVNGKNRLYGRFDSVRFDANGNNSVFQLRPVSPSINSRRYEGDLFIDIDFNRLHLINRVEFNNYLAGVVETESGAYAQMEFYKAQALLCRTYALKNTNRHIEEGFNLCDGTHCQAYKSMNMHNPDIKRAVIETEGLVVADEDSVLITAAFHANSGGQTHASRNVWLVDVPYLVSINDPFSLRGRQATWEKQIDRRKWRTYLIKHGYVPEESTLGENFTFKQKIRKREYELELFSMSLAKIRHDWELKSTFFSVLDDGQKIILQGRGYGHGVGLSQEGAMKMAEAGYRYEDILLYYFKEIKILNYLNARKSAWHEQLMEEQKDE